ncbi:MAG: AI-2E family transporter [Caldimonas sp.]
MKPETVRTAAVVALFAACLYLLRGLFVPIVWGCLIAIATWPLHERLRARLGRRAEPLSAVLLTGAVVVFLLVPLGYLFYRGLRELPELIRLWASSREEGLPAPAWIGSLPGLGAWAAKTWQETLGEPGALSGYAHDLLGTMNFAAGRTLVGVVGRHAMAVFFCVVILFFVYLSGDTLAAQVDAVLARHLGPAGLRTRVLALQAVRGAVNGLVLVGLGVALLMSVAYAVAGMPHPAALGLATGLLGMVPFGAMVVLAGVVLYLFASGAATAAIALAIFGAVAIFVADHFVRPVFMAGAARLPLVLALLGIVGGLETFGVLGLFLGPTLLAIMVAVWRELAAEDAGKTR